MAETLGQVISRIKQRIKGNRAPINVEPGSVPFDLFIDPEANEIVIQEVIQDFNKALQFVDSILSLETNTAELDVIAFAKSTTTTDILTQLSQALDALASNSNLTRRPPQFAAEFVQFTRTTNISPSDDFTIIQGTKVKTDAGTEYITTETIEINQNIGNLVPFSTVFAVTVPVQAVIAGSAGNQPAGNITTLETAVPGFTGVTNSSDISNGVDLETDVDLGNRIKTALQGNNVGTRAGYKNFVLSTGLVSDALVVGAGDPLMLRDNGFGGAVDIYVLEEDLKQVSQTITAIPPSGLIPLAGQPVRSIVGPSGLALKKDTSVFAGSVKANDQAQTTLAPPIPPFNLIYIFNQKPLLIQSLLTDDVIALDNDVLIKEALKVLIDLTTKIKILPGFDFSVVQAAVTVNLIAFIDILKIGVSIEASTIVNIIENTRGVEQVFLPFDVLNREDQINSSTPVLFVNTINIAVNEFARLGILTINPL